MSDGLTPEQEAVRRLLADARHDGAPPPEVVARLDETLAALVAHRGATPAAPAAPVVDLAARRRRAVGVGLLAAAAVVVGGVAVGQVLPPMQGADESTSAGGSVASDDAGTAREFGEGSGSAAEEPAQDGSDGEMTSPQAKTNPPAGAPTLSTGDADLDDELLRLRATAATRASQLGSLDRNESCDLDGVGRGRRVVANVDGQLGVVVFRRPSGDLQEAAIYVCGSSEPVRVEVLPAP